MKVDILAIGAHPDDVELGCSGTLLRHLAMGYSVGLLDLTLGELGTRGNALIRTEEANASAEKMGAKFRRQLALKDGFFDENETALRSVISEIRRCQPTLILANAIRDRHPDHGRGSDLVRRAAFLSGLSKIETSNNKGEKQLPWRPKSLYYYIQDEWIEPDFVVDITDFFDQKMDLVKTFRTQFFDPESTEKNTPISNPDFLPFLEGRARNMGRPAGYRYAEGFVTDRYPGVSDMLLLD